MKQISIVLATVRDEVEVLREIKDKLRDLKDVEYICSHTKVFEKYEKNRGGGI